MARGAKSQFISPAQLAEIKAELESLSKLEPGAKSVRDAVEELMPIIRGCRARGHSWKRISESFSRVEGISSASLRKYAYELNPSLKEPVKGIIPKIRSAPAPAPSPKSRKLTPTPTPAPSPKPRAAPAPAPASDSKKVSF